MTIQGLNHYNMIVPRATLAAFTRFYEDVLGFETREDPPLIWLYAAKQPLVHITLTEAPVPRDADAARHTSGVVDHVAFTCHDVAATIERIESKRVAYLRRDFPDRGFTQLVVRDPLGLEIELNFSEG